MKQHILFALLKELEVPFTSHYLKKVIAEIPSSNELFGIESILKEKYRINCTSLLISKNDIFKLETPFIVQFNSAKAPLALVTDVKSNELTIKYNSEIFTYSKNHLFKYWEGIVLLLETNKASAEKNYLKNFGTELIKRFRLPLIVTISILLFISYARVNLALSMTRWEHVALLSLYTLGIVTSVILLLQSIGKPGALVEKVCNSFSKGGCEKILEGKASKLFGLISWSEIGFIYFVGCFLSLIFFSQSLGILIVLSILVLPFSFWSIHYQWKRVRQWCPFCIIVQLILWFIFAVNIIAFYPFTVPFNIGLVSNVATCFLLPSLLLGVIIPLIKDHQALETVSNKYNNLKFNEEIIQHLMNSASIMDATTASSLIFGNPDARFSVAIITDLYCPHCVKANKHLKELLRSSRDKVRVQIIFDTIKLIDGNGNIAKEKFGDRFEEIRQLIGVLKTYDPTTAEDAYFDWYEYGVNNPQQFFKNHPVSQNALAINQELENQIEWLKKVSYRGTPTLFLNHRYLPKSYDASDLKYLVNSLQWSESEY